MTRYYQIMVQEYLDDDWSAHFDGLTITHAPDGTTTLAGAVRDQTALYGLLAKLRDLGLTLLSLSPITGTPVPEAGTDACSAATPTPGIGTQGGTDHGNSN